MKFIILLFLLVGCSCSKEEKLYTPTELYFLTQKAHPEFELVAIPNDQEFKRVLCSHYKEEGCVTGSGKRLKIHKVELLTIQYKNTKSACLSALSVGQWHARNWLFDDVTDEPVLEYFLKKNLEGVRPLKKEDCLN